jgi:hypothetical protein
MSSARPSPNGHQIHLTKNESINNKHIQFFNRKDIFYSCVKRLKPKNTHTRIIKIKIEFVWSEKSNALFIYIGRAHVRILPLRSVVTMASSL